MPRISIGFGVALIVLGVAGYAASGGASVTALIPAVFGLLLVVTGVVARKEHLRMHAMHAAALVGIFGFLGSARGLVGLVTMLSGGQVARPGAVWAQAIMAALMAAFVWLCVKSFIDVRRARAASGA